MSVGVYSQCADERNRKQGCGNTPPILTEAQGRQCLCTGDGRKATRRWGKRYQSDAVAIPQPSCRGRRRGESRAQPQGAISASLATRALRGHARGKGSMGGRGGEGGGPCSPSFPSSARRRASSLSSSSMSWDPASAAGWLASMAARKESCFVRPIRVHETERRLTQAVWPNPRRSTEYYPTTVFTSTSICHEGTVISGERAQT